MHELIKISEKAENEIGKIANKAELTLADIEAACKAVDLIKKIEETLVLRNEASYDNSEMYGNYGRTYGRYGTNYYMGNGNYRSSAQNSYRGIDYGHGSEKEKLVDKLETMMATSGNEQYRQLIAETVDRINRLGN